MKFAIYDVVTGQILRVIRCVQESADASVQEGHTAHVPCDTEDDTTHYVQDGALVPFPPAPAYGQWDWTTKAWVDNLARAKADKLAAIVKERDRRMDVAIQFDGRNLDADATAQRNISAKRSELQDIANGIGEVYPELLIWRDADNQLATFGSITEMGTWLAKLTAAITQRGTMAYAWSWTLKAQLDAATTLDEVAAVSLS